MVLEDIKKELIFSSGVHSYSRVLQGFCKFAQMVVLLKEYHFPLGIYLI